MVTHIFLRKIKHIVCFFASSTLALIAGLLVSAQQHMDRDVSPAPDAHGPRLREQKSLGGWQCLKRLCVKTGQRHSKNLERILAFEVQLLLERGQG